MCFVSLVFIFEYFVIVTNKCFVASCRVVPGMQVLPQQGFAEFVCVEVVLSVVCQALLTTTQRSIERA